jgi:rhamnosyltransferase subunit B
MRPLSILLAPVGSEGDIRPLLWFAGGLAARGHWITFIITPYYQHLVAARGWRSLPVGAAERFHEIMRDPRLWQPRRGTELVLRFLLESLPVYQRALDAANEHFDLVIATTIGTGALTWAEKNRVPRLMAHLQPICLRSVGDCPLFIEGAEWLCAAPPFVKHSAFWFFDQVVARAMLRPLNTHRASLGLPPLRRVNDDLWQGADGIAAFFPDWFAPPQPEWPAHLRQFGFPRETVCAPSSPLPQPLENFLASGPPPILWTHGSANLDTEKFAAGARAATAALGARGLLVGPALANAPSDENFLCLAHAPFEQVFPRCRAVVHHGGIGTLVQALAAGIPQLVVPRSHDQPDNGRRLQRLGVGAVLAYKKFSGETAAAKLRALLDSASTRAACAEYRQKILAADPLPSLCAWAEELAEKSD